MPTSGRYAQNSKDTKMIKMVIRDILNFPARMFRKIIYRLFPGHSTASYITRDIITFPARMWNKLVYFLTKKRF